MSGASDDNSGEDSSSSEEEWYPGKMLGLEKQEGEWYPGKILGRRKKNKNVDDNDMMNEEYPLIWKNVDQLTLTIPT